MEEKANTGQLKIIHQLVSKAKLTDQKKTLVHSFSNGRETSSKELLHSEAKLMISYLLPLANMEDKSNRMRRKILSVFHRMGWQQDGEKIDMERVNQWCVNKSYLKKTLMEYTSQELVKLVNQVQQFYSHIIKQSS